MYHADKTFGNFILFLCVFSFVVTYIRISFDKWLTFLKEKKMKNRRISITSRIIEGIERMLNSDKIDQNNFQPVLEWVQNIKRFPMQKYSDLFFAKGLLHNLNLLKTFYYRHVEEKNGLVYHKSVLDAFMYIDKVNEKYGEVAPIAAEVEQE